MPLNPLSDRGVLEAGFSTSAYANANFKCQIQFDYIYYFANALTTRAAKINHRILGK